MVEPRPDWVASHLQFLFGQDFVGYIEITGIRTDAHGGGNAGTAYFDLDQLEDAAEYALKLNARPGVNVYVGAALRKHVVLDEHGRQKAARDDDVQGTRNLFADFDEGHDFDAAKAKLIEAGIRPAAVVITGRTPSRRAQMWWPLETPILDIEVIRSTLRGIQQGLKADAACTSAKQIMRLAGTLNWPKKDGRTLEVCELQLPKLAPQALMLEQVHRAFPPQAAATPGGVDTGQTVVRQRGSLGLDGDKLEDRHELKAFRILRAVVRNMVGEFGVEPTSQMLYDEAWPTYERQWNKDKKPLRGPAFFAQKCKQAERDFQRGMIPGCEDLAAGVASWKEKHGEIRAELDKAADDSDEDGEGESDGDLFEVLSMADIRNLPDPEWLVEDTIPQNGLGFIYGEPGCGKSFIALDFGLTLAYGEPTWMDRPIKPQGSVLYLAAEGAAGMNKRIEAWQRKRGVKADAEAFRLIRKPMSFMEQEDADKLVRTVEAIVKRSGSIAVVFVDTVSRVLPGSDENLQKEMTLFIGACDRIREVSGATVIGVHHPSKAGGMRGSTVFLGAGDCVFKVEKEEDGKGGTIKCEKQKEAADGWTRTFAFEPQEWLTPGRIKATSSLTVSFEERSVAAEVATANAWPGVSTCRAALNEINAAWVKKSPWSPHKRAISEGRFAQENLARAFRMPFRQAEFMVFEWQRTGVLTFEQCDSKTKSKGLRVAQWPDWRGGNGGNGSEKTE